MFQKEKSTYAPDQNPVRLTVEEQASLRALISKGQSSARAIRRAQILLAADENRPGGGSLKELEIAERMQVHVNTVYIVRKAYAQQGWEGAIGRKKRATPPVPPKVTGEVEAKIIALSCSAPPSGRSRWTLELLADRAVELKYIDSISHETVRQVLKKRTQTSPS
ncbi:helix-turn-helix domain-containing protein [Paenibacillus larvae]|uniref:Transposase n=1 Tax=Paenibacillus larvae subsp. larvae TaxID=147375 RepID=A0A6C0QSS8_9BACL|nr:helix-turn-helix domain-containing protein [Paenibacillus larvae]MCY7477388.1 helix-turn-helix domain-containing protein [Paenibacillus larvae]MDE5127365.1 helix-turn-helix domain-containing protein [Paenibacillus larvae subsp. larvae]MDE5134943.1 helix-turn-helix domain-containing protein [Paenibacillus larvae subsp. larvae]MDE5138983.1 helix-turn-helix domain-containing protein [Paenibacillus larvae subsp. larvae]MDE5143115.1 helix-turn-helix domain-containing protein [Paenibacillus larva